MRQLTDVPMVVVQVQVADLGRSGYQQRNLGAIRRRVVGENIVRVAGGRFDFARLGVDSLQISLPFLGGIHDDAASIRGPKGFGGSRSTRGRLVASDSPADVVIVSRGQIARRAAFKRSNKQIRLAVRSLLDGDIVVDVSN